MSAQAQDLTIRKSITVDVPVEHAFEVFTERIGTWWPLETHSIEVMCTGKRPETAVFEPHVGGRVYERRSDGGEGFWATVAAFEPPHRLVLEWKVNPEAPAATEIEVSFTPEGDGRTRVDLVHSGWEPYGDRAQEARDDYDSNWLGVLGKFKTEAEG
jgi:uncharacterized protein YndB with AHSA1/START domain